MQTSPENLSWGKRTAHGLVDMRLARSPEHESFPVRFLRGRREERGWRADFSPPRLKEESRGSTAKCGESWLYPCFASYCVSAAERGSFSRPRPFLAAWQRGLLANANANSNANDVNVNVPFSTTTLLAHARSRRAAQLHPILTVPDVSRASLAV